MKTLAIFNQKDVFPEQEDNKEGIVFEDRITGKAIIFDQYNNIALVANKVNSYRLLPGGGVETGESIENGIMRECKEEIGCIVDSLSYVGTTEDYRNRDKKHCISHCYSGRVVGEKGELKLTESEKSNGLHVVWVSLDEAISILSSELQMLKEGKVEFYNTGYNILRDHIFLVEFKNNIK